MQESGASEVREIPIPSAQAGNQEPTQDFIQGLLAGPPAMEISAGFDHLRSAQIVQAAYLSAIRGTVEAVTLEKST